MIMQLMQRGREHMVVAICDDDLKELSLLRTYLEEYIMPSGEHLILDSFQNGVELIQSLKGKQYDLLIIQLYHSQHTYLHPPYLLLNPVK